MKDYGIGYFNAFLLAVIVYMLFLFAVFFSLEKEKQAVKYTDIENSFIDIDLGSFSTQKPNATQVDEDQQNKDLIEGQNTTNKEIQTEQVDQKESSISSLFSNLKEYQEEKSTKVQSSKKSTPNAANLKEASKLVEQLGDNLIEEKSPVGQSSQSQITGVYDEFLGRVGRRLRENWTLYEKSGNFRAKLDFVIKSDGKFSYTFVSKSGNAEFDEKVMDFLQNLQDKFIAYPPNQQDYQGTAYLDDKVSM